VICMSTEVLLEFPGYKTDRKKLWFCACDTEERQAIWSEFSLEVTLEPCESEQSEDVDLQLTCHCGHTAYQTIEIPDGWIPQSYASNEPISFVGECDSCDGGNAQSSGPVIVEWDEELYSDLPETPAVEDQLCWGNLSLEETDRLVEATRFVIARHSNHW